MRVYKEQDGIRFEAPSLFALALKTTLLNPAINFLIPKWALLKIIKRTQSPLVHESIKRPGGWRSMEISYADSRHVDWIDRLVLTYGTFPMGLRNRRRLVVKRLCELIGRYSGNEKVTIVSIGAGPGTNLIEAMCQSEHNHVYAHCIDLDSDAFAFGEALRDDRGLRERIRYIEGNAEELKGHLINVAPHIIKMIGLLEYLTDEQLRRIFRASFELLTDGGSIVINSIADRHGHDRFMRRLFNLHLVYRSSERLIDTLKEAGFGNFEVSTEPLKIYSIIVGRKRE